MWTDLKLILQFLPFDRSKDKQARGHTLSMKIDRINQATLENSNKEERLYSNKKSTSFIL